MTKAETESLARQIFAERHAVPWEDAAPSSPARQQALREAREQLRTHDWPRTRPVGREAWMDHGEAVEAFVGEMKALLTDARPFVSRCVDQDRRSWRDGAAQAVLGRIDTVLSGDDAK